MLQHLLGGCAQALYLPREFCSLYWCAAMFVSAEALPLQMRSHQPLCPPCIECSLFCAAPALLGV